MRVFNHSYPLALLGADVLKPRVGTGGFTYSGMVNEVEGNQIKSFIIFKNGQEERKVLCIAYPGSMSPPASEAGRCL